MLKKMITVTACAVIALGVTATGASAKRVGGVKVEDNLPRHSGQDDMIDGVKVRGDGSVDDLVRYDLLPEELALA